MTLANSQNAGAPQTPAAGPRVWLPVIAPVTTITWMTDILKIWPAKKGRRAIDIRSSANMRARAAVSAGVVGMTITQAVVWERMCMRTAKNLLNESTGIAISIVPKRAEKVTHESAFEGCHNCVLARNSPDIPKNTKATATV